jgi:DNA (cytosine-5)-methyltransferase 1
VDNAILNTISLCTGVAMLDEGVHAGLEFLGIRSRTVIYAEREAFPVSVLAARMEEGSLAPAPVWFGDFTELPAGRFRGVVDGVVAGFPCQDLSVAGRRAGLDGKRSGLFFNVLDIADVSGAWFLVLENVAGIASATATVVDEEEGELEERAAARVMGELADRGWNAEWITLSASDVGASHGRARWFCFAWRQMADAKGQRGRVGQRPEFARRAEAERAGKQLDDPARHGRDGHDRQAGSGRGVCEAGDELADAQDDNGRRELQSGGEGCGRAGLAGIGTTLADADSARLQGLKRRGGANQNGWEITYGSISECRSVFAPGPSDARWTGILARFPWLAPAITDQEAEQLLRGVADGLAPRLDFSCRAARLRAGGNGVVPLCAATAVVVLIRRSGVFG